MSDRSNQRHNESTTSPIEENPESRSPELPADVNPPETPVDKISRAVKDENEEAERRYSYLRTRTPRRRTGMLNLSHIPKLEGSSNYEAWVTGIQGIALTNRVWKVMNGTIKRPVLAENPSPTQLETYELKLDDWEEAEEVAQGYILQTIKQGPRAHLSQEMDAPTMFAKLKETYKLKGYTERHIHWKNINRSTLAQYGNASEYAESIKKSRTKLGEMGYTVPDWMVTSSFLHGLGEKYNSFVTLILNTRQKGTDGTLVEPEFDSIVEQLIDMERRDKISSEGNSNSRSKALRTGEDAEFNKNNQRKNQPQSKSQNPNADQKCSFCNLRFHTDKKCWYKQPELATDKWQESHREKVEELRQKSKESKAKTAPSSETKKKGGMVTRANKTVPYKDPAWYMDSAASYHMTYDPGLFQSMRSSSKEVELADGTTIRAKGVGTIELDILVAGETMTQPLFDVYYIPDLDSNLLLIGCFE